MPSPRLQHSANAYSVVEQVRKQSGTTFASCRGRSAGLPGNLPAKGLQPLLVGGGVLAVHLGVQPLLEEIMELGRKGQRERHYDELGLDPLGPGRRAAELKRGVTSSDRIEDGLPGALLRAGGRYARRGGWSWPSPSRSRLLMRRRPTEMILTLPPDDKVAKFAAYPAARDLR